MKIIRKIWEMIREIWRKSEILRSFVIVITMTIAIFYLYWFITKSYWSDLTCAKYTRSGFLLLAAWLTTMVISIFLIISSINNKSLIISQICANVQKAKCSELFYDIKGQLKIIYVTASLLMLFLGLLEINSITKLNKRTIEETRDLILMVLGDPALRGEEFDSELADKILERSNFRENFEDSLAHYYSTLENMNSLFEKIITKSDSITQAGLVTLSDQYRQLQEKSRQFDQLQADIKKLQESLDEQTIQDYDLSFSIIYSLRKNEELRKIIYADTEPKMERLNEALEKVKN